MAMLERLSDVELTRYLLKLGPQYPGAVHSDEVSVPQCLNNLIRLVDYWGE
jgi:hypothetical protein